MSKGKEAEEIEAICQDPHQRQTTRFNDSQRAILQQYRAAGKPAWQTSAAFAGEIAHKIDQLRGGRPGNTIVRLCLLTGHAKSRHSRCSGQIAPAILCAQDLTWWCVQKQSGHHCRDELVWQREEEGQTPSHGPANYRLLRGHERYAGKNSHETPRRAPRPLAPDCALTVHHVLPLSVLAPPLALRTAPAWQLNKHIHGGGGGRKGNRTQNCTNQLLATSPRTAHRRC